MTFVDCVICRWVMQATLILVGVQRLLLQQWALIHVEFCTLLFCAFDWMINLLNVLSTGTTTFSDSNSCCSESHVRRWEWETGNSIVNLTLFSWFTNYKSSSKAGKLDTNSSFFAGEQCCCWRHNIAILTWALRRLSLNLFVLA